MIRCKYYTLIGVIMLFAGGCNQPSGMQHDVNMGAYRANAASQLTVSDPELSNLTAKATARSNGPFEICPLDEDYAPVQELYRGSDSPAALLDGAEEDDSKKN